MLVGMVPGTVVMEPGEKDAVRRMGWVRKKKDRAACWEAGPVNLTKVYGCYCPGSERWSMLDLQRDQAQAVVKGVAPIVCLACPTPSQPILLHPKDI